MPTYLQKSAAALAAILIVGISFTTILATPGPAPAMLAAAGAPVLA